MTLTALALFAAQAGVVEVPVEQDRLRVCLDKARRDPTTAIADASQWFGEASGAERALPQQCLGQAYVSLLRWDAAEEAFAEARALAINASERARLGAMAGSAALPDARYVDALARFKAAEADALEAGDAELAGSIATDRSRALVGLGQVEDAAQALELARSQAPQYPDAWLLSATLARREDKLEDARSYIPIAAKLAPNNPDIALEAGVIALLSGDDEGARRNWQAVGEMAQGTAQAETAAGYIAQLSRTDG